MATTIKTTAKVILSPRQWLCLIIMHVFLRFSTLSLYSMTVVSSTETTHRGKPLLAESQRSKLPPHGLHMAFRRQGQALRSILLEVVVSVVADLVAAFHQQSQALQPLLLEAAVFVVVDSLAALYRVVADLFEAIRPHLIKTPRKPSAVRHIEQSSTRHMATVTLITQYQKDGFKTCRAVPLPCHETLFGNDAFSLLLSPQMDHHY